MNKQHKKFVVFAGFCLLMFLVFIYLVFSLTGANFLTGNKVSSDSNTTAEGSFNALPGVKNNTTPQEKELNRRSSSVMNLLNVVPVKGINFTFDYDYNLDEFLLGINSRNPELGNIEFDNFLKENGVSRSWIRNLTTTEY